MLQIAVLCVRMCCRKDLPTHTVNQLWQAAACAEARESCCSELFRVANAETCLFWQLVHPIKCNAPSSYPTGTTSTSRFSCCPSSPFRCGSLGTISIVLQKNRGFCRNYKGDTYRLCCLPCSSPCFPPSFVPQKRGGRRISSLECDCAPALLSQRQALGQLCHLNFMAFF